MPNRELSQFMKDQRTLQTCKNSPHAHGGHLCPEGGKTACTRMSYGQLGWRSSLSQEQPGHPGKMMHFLHELCVEERVLEASVLSAMGLRAARAGGWALAGTHLRQPVCLTKPGEHSLRHEHSHRAGIRPLCCHTGPLLSSGPCCPCVGWAGTGLSTPCSLICLGLSCPLLPEADPGLEAADRSSELSALPAMQWPPLSPPTLATFPGYIPWPRQPRPAAQLQSAATLHVP